MLWPVEGNLLPALVKPLLLLKVEAQLPALHYLPARKLEQFQSLGFFF